jgi:hypothetical protein
MNGRPKLMRQRETAPVAVTLIATLIAPNRLKALAVYEGSLEEGGSR